MPQRQQYPTNDQHQLQTSPLTLLAPSANCGSALRAGQVTQSTTFNSNNPTGNASNRPRGAPYQPIPRQPYQSNSPYRGYQRSDEKGVYQVDDGATEDQPEGFYTMFEAEGEDITY